MDGSVSVTGAHNQIHTLTFDTQQTLALAQQLAEQVNHGVMSGSIIPADNNTAPTVWGGSHEYIQTTDGAVTLPMFYNTVVLDTANATVAGSAGPQVVLAGGANVTFKDDQPFASGSIALGSGNDKVTLGARTGSFTIDVGNGNDTISAKGFGEHHISLGSGIDMVTVAGSSTVQGGGGKEKVVAQGSFGKLAFIGGSGDASVTGSQRGINDFTAGTGNETLVGGASNHLGQDTFTFIKGQAGGEDVIKNFSWANDRVYLHGYSLTEVTNALSHQSVGATGVTITLSDHTEITFADVSTLKPSNFRSS